MTTIQTILDDYLIDLAERSPEAAEAIGREGVVQIPDLSPQAFSDRADLMRTSLSAIERAEENGDVRAPGDRVLVEAVKERLGSDIALADIGFTGGLLAPLATPVHLVRQVFDGLDRDTPAQWERVGEHLTLVPEALEQYFDTLVHTAEAGYLVPRRQIEVVARQCDSWVADGFYENLVADPSGSESPEWLRAGAEHASRATARFASRLRGELLERASDVDARGRELYEVTSSAFLGADVDLDELYDWGWSEIDRLTRRANNIARRLTGSADLRAAVHALDADPSGRVEVGTELRDWLQSRLNEVTVRLDGRWFNLPTAAKPVEANLATADSGVMYYTAPDASGMRPGRVWWSVPRGTTSVATWREVSTVHHEGLPGHHLQHVITQGLDLHPWQRWLCHVHGYAEGWAHYSEHISEDMGLLADDGELLGMIFAQLWRACRIVIDIGLHLEKPIPINTGIACLDGVESWKHGVGVEMLVEVAEVDPATARFEVDRYLGWPGQALAFKVGAKLWHDARDAAGRSGMTDFKEFHMAALELGPMGLGPLADALSTVAAERVS